MTKKLRKLTRAEKDAYVLITELIGELSWGEGLPIDMPDGSYIIFDAIYQKLKNTPTWKVLPSLRKKIKTLEHENEAFQHEIEYLRDLLKDAHSELLTQSITQFKYIKE